MPIVGAMIIGGIVGAFVRLVAPRTDPGGFTMTILLSIAGAVTGGFIGRLVGWNPAGFTVAGAFASGMGAMILLLAYRAFANRPRTT